MAHGPKNDHPHILLKDTPWWVNKRGIAFSPRSTFVFQKIRQKTVQDADHFKYSGHKCAEYQHKNFAPKQCKNKFALLLFVYSYGRYGRSFKLKTRIFPLNLNSQRAVKNRISCFQNLIWSTFSSHVFPVCGVTPNHLRFKLWLVQVFFFLTA